MKADVEPRTRRVGHSAADGWPSMALFDGILPSSYKNSNYQLNYQIIQPSFSSIIQFFLGFRCQRDVIPFRILNLQFSNVAQTEPREQREPLCSHKWPSRV